MKIEDIAKIAKVSNAAVSLALNGKGGISEKTRNRILSIVKETGYQHRSLSKRGQPAAKKKVLKFLALANSGIVLHEYQKQPFFSELIGYIEDFCSSLGYSLLFKTLQSAGLNGDIEKTELEDSDGIILLGTNLSRKQIMDIAGQQQNLVVLDTYYDTLNVDFIVMNSIMGAYQAGKYLIQQGHRNIGIVQSNTRMVNFDNRERGFIQALEEENIAIDKNNYFSVSPTIVTSQEEFISMIAPRKDNLPTALFCECDYIAISVMKSLRDLGIHVPDDISIIGFDDIPEAQIVTPELTTIRVEKEKIAEMAVKRLIEMIESPQSIHTKITIDTQLIERKSCSALQ